MKKIICRTAALLAALVSGSTYAKVTPEEAARLGSELTPMGAEKAGNKDGTIPAWEGGLTKRAAGYKGRGNRYCDPFAADKPLFTITAANVDAVQGQAGGRARWRCSSKYPGLQDERLPDAAHRGLAATASTRRPRTTPPTASSPRNGEALQRCRRSAFRSRSPRPATRRSGTTSALPRRHRALRWNAGRGHARRRLHLVKLRGRDASLRQPGHHAERELNNVMLYFLQIVTRAGAPGRHRSCWCTRPWTRSRSRAAPGSTTPASAACAARRTSPTTTPAPRPTACAPTTDFDMFNGATDRYDWKLVGKKEMYVPYNSYRSNAN